MVDLERRDVDLTSGEPVVRHGKGAKRRTAHMSPGHLQALDRLPRKGDRVLGGSPARAATPASACGASLGAP